MGILMEEFVLMGAGHSAGSGGSKDMLAHITLSVRLLLHHGACISVAHPPLCIQVFSGEGQMVVNCIVM